MKKHAHILFLAASPTNADRLALDVEARAIQREIESTGSHLRLETRWAAEPLDLLREIRAVRPTVLHLAGYGGLDGVYLQDHGGDARLVTLDVLKMALEAAGQSVRVVLLTVHHTAEQLDDLLAIVDCVIVTGSTDGAPTFAREFYRALAAGCSVGTAHARGCSSPEVSAKTRIVVRAGVDAEKIFIEDVHR